MQTRSQLAAHFRATVFRTLRPVATILVGLSLSACADMKVPTFNLPFGNENAAPAIKPTLGVLPFESRVDSSDGISRQLGAFEAHFYSAAVAKQLAANEWPAFYTPIEPPAGVDYLLKGTIVATDGDKIQLDLDFRDASGTSLDTEHVSVSRGDLKGQRMSSATVSEVTRAVSRFARSVTPEKVDDSARRNVARLLEDDHLKVSPERLQTYKNLSVLLRTQLLTAPQARAVKFADEQAPIYDRLRFELGRISDQRSAASTRRTLSFLGGLAMFASGMAQASTGQMDNATANQVATAATASIMNGAAEDEKVTALEKQMKDSLGTFSTFTGERLNEFSVMGSAVQAGTIDQQYGEVRRLAKALILQVP